MIGGRVERGARGIGEGMVEREREREHGDAGEEDG